MSAPPRGRVLATSDTAYSGRLWHRTGPRQDAPVWCENVRLVGARIKVSWNSQLRPAPRFRPEQDRTVSSWGPALQADLARLHIGVIGAGSVGALVAEALARVGVEWITLLDFDTVEAVNLDRLLHASPRDARLARAAGRFRWTPAGSAVGRQLGSEDLGDDFGCSEPRRSPLTAMRRLGSERTARPARSGCGPGSRHLSISCHSLSRASLMRWLAALAWPSMQLA